MKFKIAFENVEPQATSVSADSLEDPNYAGVVENSDADTLAIIQAQALPEEHVDVSDVAVDELAAAVESLRYAIEFESNESSRIMDTVDNLYELGNKISTSDELPEEVMLATAQNAVAGTDATPGDILSVEAFRENKALALEGLGDKLSTAVMSIGDGLVTSAKNSLNFLHLQIQFTNKQKTVIIEQIAKLKELQSSKKNMTVSGNRFLVVDEKVVTNFKEYEAQLAKTTDFLSQLMIRVEKFTRGNFLSKIKGTAAILSASTIVSYNKHFNDLYTNMTTEFLNPLSTLPGMQKVGSEDTRTDFKCTSLLGGGSLTVSTSSVVVGAKSNLAAKEITGVTGDLHAKFSMASGMPKTATVNFEGVTGSEIQKILEKSQLLVQRLESYNTFVTRWVSFWAGMGMLNNTASMPVNGGVGVALSQWLFAIVRIVRLGGYMVFNMTSSTFSYAKGLIDNNIKIANAYLNAA